MDFSRTHFSLRRPILSYTKVQKLYGRLIRGKKCQLAHLRHTEKQYLNVGCGSNNHPDFINLDYEWRPGIDLCWDITQGVPFPDSSLNGVFTEHCLEHISFDQCLAALREFKRALKPASHLRVIVPNGGSYLDLYQKWKRGERSPFPYVDKQGDEDLREDSRIRFTPMMAVNRIFRGYGHLFAYDEETFSGLLMHAGFRDVREESFRTGKDPVLLIDSELRKPQSLFMEATS